MSTKTSGGPADGSATSALALKSVTLRNWKSFREATLHLAEVTLLIGANASGKSNALEALKLLGWMAKGGRLGALQHATRDGELGLRGALADLTSRDLADPVLRFACAFSGGDHDLGELTLSLGIKTADGEPSVVEEALDAPRMDTSVPLYRVARAADEVGNVLSVEYNNFARGKKPQISCVNSQAVFTQLTTPARFGATHKRSQDVVPRACEEARTALVGMLFLDPNPSAMRGYADRTDQNLRGDGSNVSSVLYHLAQDDAVRARLLEFVQALPEQQVTGISFVETPRAEVMVQLLETFGGKERLCDAPLLSDGTLRVLSIAAALLSVRPGTLVVIEEIDNGVHPSRAAKLLATIREVAAARGLRVLLTTHNPALLDTLPMSAVPDVTVCYRDPDTGSSELVRLRDLERYPSLVARGPLGQLVTQGVVDRYVKAKESEDERTRKALSWVDSIMGEEAQP